MRFTMTKAEALRIQAEQIAWYNRTVMTDTSKTPTCDYEPSQGYSDLPRVCHEPGAHVCPDCEGTFCEKHSDTCMTCGRYFCIACIFDHEQSGVFFGVHTLTERSLQICSKA